ncbi:MAG TPA: cation:dicarboxylase symporter family transporter [Polyangiaceae bacterium]
MTESKRVLAALAFALVLGAAVALSGSAEALRLADLVAPVGALWVNAIRMTVIPLIVSLLVTGVSSTAGSAIGRMGARTIAVFVLLSSGTALVMIPLLRMAFTMMPSPGSTLTLPSGAAEAAHDVAAASGQAQTFAGWLTSLIPTNPIAAAASGAMLPLVLFTLLFAVALTRVEQRSRETVLSFFRGIADAMLTLVRWIILLAPVGVFALVLPLASRAGASLVGAIGFYIAAYSLGCVVAILLLYAAVAAATRGRAGISRYAKALLPAQLIAFSSSSSIASLPPLVEGAERLDVPPSVTGFVLPLAVSVFKVAGPVSWSAGALFVSHFYGVPLGASGLVIVALASVFLTFGLPGIPRGAFIMLAPLFAAIGLPVEGIGILIAVDAIPDTFATVLNVSGHMAAVTIVSRHSEAG